MLPVFRRRAGVVPTVVAATVADPAAPTNALLGPLLHGVRRAPARARSSVGIPVPSTMSPWASVCAATAVALLPGTLKLILRPRRGAPILATEASQRRICSGVLSRATPVAAQAVLPGLTSELRPELYEGLLNSKVERLRGLLGDRLHVPLDVFPSPPLRHRMKCTFSIRHFDDEKLALCMEEAASRQSVVVSDYPILCDRLRELMAGLQVHLPHSREARFRAFQLEMLANTHGDAMVCIMYHRALTESFLEAAHALSSTLRASVVGRSRGKRFVAGEGRLVQWHEVDCRNYPQIHQELTFSQSNAHICGEMLRWVAGKTRPGWGGARDISADLLELHCGSGSFTLPLAANFRRVLATETCRAPVQLAKESAAMAGVKNVDFARLSTEEVWQALIQRVEFRRMRGIDFKSLNLSTVLVDPPRCGLDEAALSLIRTFERIVYISCNPSRLAAELQRLREFDICSAALFDQFPYTEHMEAAVVLQRR